ncbi:hypothetical protein AMECASPLE_006889 [Ameca splendens]|uniref:Laminin G domain-containing protein n=1 Tax=Ameca splendens TaxID=208324 RepID=A0ABV0ZVG3_9TELE
MTALLVVQGSLNAMHFNSDTLHLQSYYLAGGRSLSVDRLHLVSLGSLLDDQHWHLAAVEHHSSNLNLTVDKNTKWVAIPPWFTHWDYDQMTVGADQNRSSRNLNRNFHGCLENLVYNGLNLIELAKQKDQRVTVMVNRLPVCM